MEFVITGIREHVLKNLQGVYRSVQSETLAFPTKNHHFECVRKGKNKQPVAHGLCLALLTSACSDEPAKLGQSMTLDPPSELQATRIAGRAAVRLTWPTPKEEFAVQRREKSGLVRERVFTVHDMTSAIDSVGLTIGAAYSYPMHAMRYAESSMPSNIASITLTS